MGPIRGRVEEDSGGPHGVFTVGDRETDEEANRWNLAAEGVKSLLKAVGR